MTILDARPDPQTVSHEAVANVARQRAAALFEDVILRDAKIAEQTAYITQLEARIRELEARPAPHRPPGSVATALPGDHKDD